VIVVFGIAVQALMFPHSGPVQSGAAQVFGTPAPPHVSPVGHVPQLGVNPPHPSATTPHVAPAAAHVRGVHMPPSVLLVPHVNSVPPPPQVSGAVHVPQSTTPPQPSPIGPHVAP
jgi:hypothetical protein